MTSTETVHASGIIPASPANIYAAWLDGEHHTAMTGGAATCEPGVGGRFTAWDGYIEGKNLELAQDRRIVQSWRSSEFPKQAADSRLIVLFEKVTDGTRVTIVHTEIPAGQGKSYESGWDDHYLAPMKKHFAAKNKGAKKQAVKKKPVKKKPAKKQAAKKR